MIKPKHSVLLDYLQVILRRKQTVLLCLGGVTLLVVLISLFSTPVYEAEATLIYAESKAASFALDEGQPFITKGALINLTEQLKSRALAKEVTQALPEQVAEKIKALAPKPAGSSEDSFVDIYLQENLAVALVPGSDIVKIKVQANDPVTAKIVANTYTERIIDWNLRRKREEVSSIRDFVEGQLQDFQNRLNAAEEALQEFKEQNKMLSLNEASAEILTRMTQAEVIYNEARAQRTALEQRQRYVEQKKQELAPSLTITATPEAEQLKQQLQELEMQYSSRQAQGLSENNPEMAAQKQKISQVKQELAHELLKTSQRNNLIDPLSQIKNLLQESIALEVDLETNKAREQGLAQIIAGYEKELQTLPKQELELTRLIRAREVNNRIYSMLLEKREEVRITEAGKIGDVRVLDAAEEPIHPIMPNKVRNLLLGLLLGLTVGVGLAFFLESLDTSLKSREDVEKYMNLPVLASIPSIKSGSEKNGNGARSLVKRNQHTAESLAEKLFSRLNGNTQVVEAYRALQINFAFLNSEGVLKSILVSSPGQGEGKTLTAINMAQAFARSGMKTLLIDCDLRRPSIHKVLGLDQEPGVTNVLIGQVPVHHAIQNTENEKLSVLTCGTLLPHPSDILHTKGLRDLLVDLKNEYELIILDAPPLIAVTDSIVLGTEVDGVCLVIKSGRTSYDAALRAKSLLENGHTRIIGTILNDVDLKSVYGYRKEYYY
jgi:tyrosine-protein kinase Etk/Wzc